MIFITHHKNLPKAASISYTKWFCLGPGLDFARDDSVLPREKRRFIADDISRITDTRRDNFLDCIGLVSGFQKEKILQEKNKAEEILHNLEKEKEELLPKIPSDQMKLYKQISSTKNGIVLSPVTDEFCTMCHMRVRPQVVNELIARREIITCENCGRILQYKKKPE